MDMQKCQVCKKEFDFDEEGLGCGQVIVCSGNCAKKSAKSRGNAYAIHDKSDKIVDTDMDGTEQRHIHGYK